MSSLVDAGVLPRLEMTGITGNHPYQCVRMVPSQGDHPFDAMMRTLHGYAEQAKMDAHKVGKQLLSQPDQLPQLLQKILSKCPKIGEFVLFLDQMEELFTVCDRSQAHAFLAAIYRAAHEVRFRVIATIRSDFLYHCHEHADLLRLLNGQGHIGLGPIDAGSIRDMILKPAQCAGLSLSEQLVRRLTDEASHELGRLPLLAFALQQLFDKKKGNELTEQAYDGMGGLVGAIGQQVDQVMAELGKEVLGAFDTVFAALVHLDRERPPTKNRVPLTVFNADKASHQLIDALTGSECRILVKSGNKQDTVVEVAHEKLFTAWPKLKDWIKANEEAIRLIDHKEEAAKRWEDKGSHPKDLWSRESAKEVEEALLQCSRRPSATLKRMIEPQQILTEKLKSETLSLKERLEIDTRLSEFGDVRPGVGCRRDQPDQPDIAWIDIPGGQIKLEGIGPEFKVKPFRMAKYLVTNAQFEAFIKAEDGYRNEKWWNGIERSKEPSVASWQETNSPREKVSWYQAVAFCRWLRQRTGLRIRLPSEWEWQQAATGGDPARKYPWPGEWDASRCNNRESQLRESQLSRTTTVGLYPHGATVQEVMDMAGNVWEWCRNKYKEPTASGSLCSDKSNATRAIRGGSFEDVDPVAFRVSHRNWDYPNSQFRNIGFRLVQEIP